VSTPRYRKIPITFWGDPRVRTLSRPQPNAQSLLLYLITGRHTTAAPGLFTTGSAELAERLRWPVARVKNAFAELEHHGLAMADWDVGVVFLPDVVNDNPPESPSVVKAWRRAVDEIPDCPLRGEAVGQFLKFLKSHSQSFQDAFGHDLD
jgi:hypothetical protein